MKRLFVFCVLLLVAACAQQPPPPPPVAAAPPPPPPPPTTYHVYFDYNSAQLEPGGGEVVRFAANVYRATNPPTVQVIGYADPSGSPGYNQQLSRRRADAVAAALANDGVPSSALMVTARGETSDAPAPGQDRRVDVVLGGSPTEGLPPPVSMR